MEKIRAITSAIFKWGGYSSELEGYIVTTDKQEIKLGIDNSQCCCENWGYFMSEDNLEDFIGADLLNVVRVDTCLKAKDFPEFGLNEGGTIFVNIETSKGTLQFTAYNSHNGYYGHRAIVQSRQLTEEVTL